MVQTVQCYQGGRPSTVAAALGMNRWERVFLLFDLVV
jgi:hypothetical protein